MHEDLIKRLRKLQAITEHCDEQSCFECENRELCDKHDNKTLSGTYKEAADAIEAKDRRILTLQHEMMAEAESHTALVERLSKQNKKLEEVVKTAIDFIPCWIPVTERLPDNDDEVVVAFKNSADGEWWYRIDNFVDEAFCYNTAFGRNITHWMPLPEPPKEENE